MFEKEAEEWANQMYPSDGQAQRYLLMGAGFGYSKAKEEYEKRINVLTQNRDELLSELEKLEERIGELEECY